MIELLVGADDRTGALETAAACADAGLGPVEVVCHPSAPLESSRALVVDLASRHLDPSAAASRALALARVAARHHAHKIDSTLRGRWADELVARQRGSGWPLLVVPSFPALGRTCVGGEVLDHGQPVGDGPAGGDVRTPVWSSRPAAHLRAAGAPEVAEIADGRELGQWLVNRRPSFAVCDARSDEDLVRIGLGWSAQDDVLFAGTSASIGAAAGAVLRTPGSIPPRSPAPHPAVQPPVLVVCGSLHPMARRQVAALVAAGAGCAQVGSPLGEAIDALRTGRPTVLTSPAADPDPMGPEAAVAMARALGAAAHHVMAAVEVTTLIVIGGDLAAEVLGPASMSVGGSVVPGTAWSRRTGGGGPLVLTRAGGFGEPSGLVELLSGTLAR